MMDRWKNRLDLLLCQGQGGAVVTWVGKKADQLDVTRLDSAEGTIGRSDGHSLCGVTIRAGAVRGKIRSTRSHTESNNSISLPLESGLQAVVAVE